MTDKCQVDLTKTDVWENLNVPDEACATCLKVLRTVELVLSEHFYEKEVVAECRTIIEGLIQDVIDEEAKEGT